MYTMAHIPSQDLCSKGYIRNPKRTEIEVLSREQFLDRISKTSDLSDRLPADEFDLLPVAEYSFG